MSKIKEMFTASAKELRSVRCLTVTAVMIALCVTMDLLNIRVVLSPELQIRFSFLTHAIVGMFFGPVVGLMAGFCTDLLGFLVNPGVGGYFAGFTLTSMVQGMLFGLFLYRADHGLAEEKRSRRIVRAIGAKLSVNLICNVWLNTLWLTMLGGKAMHIMLPVRLAKNAVLLPLECLLLFFVCDFVLAISHSFGYSAKR